MPVQAALGIKNRTRQKTNNKLKFYEIQTKGPQNFENFKDKKNQLLLAINEINEYLSNSEKVLLNEIEVSFKEQTKNGRIQHKKGT